MIEVKGLSKHYKLVEKKPGLSGAVQGLFSRKYSVKKAVDDISFMIDQGEMVGYIGANGAGKSTTIKMLCGILTPSSGEISVSGIVPYKERSVMHPISVQYLVNELNCSGILPFVNRMICLSISMKFRSNSTWRRWIYLLKC